MGIGWNVLASLQRVAVGFTGGAGGHSAGVFDRPFAVLRPHV